MKIGWSQDQHLCHKRLGVENPLRALRELFPDNEQTGELDCLFYGGDFFDHLLDNIDDSSFHVILEYMMWRLKSAEKQGYAIRVLKGTPSHDRDQNIYWETLYRLGSCKADFKYIDKLSIESHPKLGDILYIPDQWKPTADEVWSDVQQALSEKNIDKVDWIIMHGAFKYQLPEHLRHKMFSLHDENRYSKICRNYVLVGHVHLRSRYKNIISAGSLDRLSFGEEEEKGVLKITLGKEDKIEYIPNPYARGMFTIETKDKTLEDVILEMNDVRNSFWNQDYISFRLVGDKHSEVILNLETIRKAFPNVEIKFKDSEEKSKINVVHLEEREMDIEFIDLNKDLLKELLIKKMGEISDSLLVKVDELFNE